MAASEKERARYSSAAMDVLKDGSPFLRLIRNIYATTDVLAEDCAEAARIAELLNHAEADRG